MEESFENKLLKVNLLEIYDDIVDINITPDEIIHLCSAFSCRVDLRLGNVVYAVEEKYKDKLKKYKGAKRLKWLRVNFKAIMPKPEETYLRWKQKNANDKRLNWMKRKMLALDYIANEPLLCNTEEPSSSLSMAIMPVSPFSETSGCNITSESAQTVIASQQRGTQSTPDNLIKLKNISASTQSYSSEELPSLCREDAIISQENMAHTSNNAIPPQNVQNVIPLMQESQGMSTQESAYTTFYQDMQVTSTQEFG